ncbi:hypothetical protein B0H19DRAFT_1060243 [Mycena capillaripes]|nr:hypothetical protein B0H19DRAFT_1060243 [Mycena capillaripes]
MSENSLPNKSIGRDVAIRPIEARVVEEGGYGGCALEVGYCARSSGRMCVQGWYGALEGKYGSVKGGPQSACRAPIGVRTQAELQPSAALQGSVLAPSAAAHARQNANSRLRRVCNFVGGQARADEVSVDHGESQEQSVLRTPRGATGRRESEISAARAEEL